METDYSSSDSGWTDVGVRGKEDLTQRGRRKEAERAKAERMSKKRKDDPREEEEQRNTWEKEAAEAKERVRKVEAEVEAARLQVKKEEAEEEHEGLVLKDAQQSLKEAREQKVREMVAKNAQDTIASRKRRDDADLEKWKKDKDQKLKEREDKQVADVLAAMDKEKEDAAADQALKLVEEIKARKQREDQADKDSLEEQKRREKIELEAQLERIREGERKEHEEKRLQDEQEEKEEIERIGGRDGGGHARLLGLQDDTLGLPLYHGTMKNVRFSLGDWWCSGPRCQALVGRGENLCPHCCQGYRPTFQARWGFYNVEWRAEEQYWDEIEQGVQEVYETANGPRMARQENVVQVVLPGGEQFEESKWINSKVLDRFKQLRRSKADGNYYWTARDNMGREFVSNVNWVLGGLQAGDIMGVLLRDIWERFGPFNAVSITLEEWEEILDNGMPWRRLELGHPSFIQFREESSGLRAKAEFEEQRQRDDEGGRRTLKFEFATTEFQLGGGEKFQLEVGPRMSTTQGLDCFTPFFPLQNLLGCLPMFIGQSLAGVLRISNSISTSSRPSRCTILFAMQGLMNQSNPRVVDILGPTSNWNCSPFPN